MKALALFRESAVLRRFTGLALFCLVFLILPTSCSSALRGDSVAPDYTGEQLFRGLLLNQGPAAELVPTATAQIPSLKEMIQDAEQLKAALTVEDHLIAQIGKDSPNFFSGFKKLIQSGDHLLIKSALQQANEVTLKSIYRLPEYIENKVLIEKSRKTLSNIDCSRFVDGTGKVDTKALQKHVMIQLQSSTSGGSQSNCVVLPLVIVAAVAVLVAYALGVVGGVALVAAMGYALIAAYITAFSTPGPGENLASSPTQLRNEIIIDEIATNFQMASLSR